MPPDLAAPDLLCADARPRLDRVAVREALVFAFAAGGSSEMFDDVVARASLPPSSWQKSAFARDLYLDEIATKSLALAIGGKPHPSSVRYVARVLAEPPEDPRDLEVRRDVLRELGGRRPCAPRSRACTSLRCACAPCCARRASRRPACGASRS